MSTNYFDFEKQRPRISRREAIRRAMFAASGLVLANHLSFKAYAAPRNARAKAVIQIWMWGGPSHIDIFDPKPDAGYDYCGPLKTPIETNVSGIRIGELLPSLAKQADKYSIIRSMTHGNNGHETASYFDEAGFLGSRFKPFATGGNPSLMPFAVEGVVAPGITDQRQKNRRELLHHLDTLAQALPEDPQIAAATQSENMAYDMILGDGAKVFDLSQEKPEMRNRYGKTKFGQSCLVARRLVERGIPYVTINYGGWDTHKENFQAMRRQLPDLDKGFATLLQDLSERALLDSTIVWWGGEFGRTPKVMWEAPWNGGRGHYGKVFSAVLAGGGFKGGQVVGASDARGEEVKDRPVYPVDLIGSIYGQMGIEATTKLPNPEGLPTFVLPKPEDGIKSAGLLKEIMSA